MSNEFNTPENTDDLHTLMAIAVLCGHKGIQSDVSSIYETWAQVYPDDALGNIGRGLKMIGEGKAREGFMLIDETSKTAATRREQAVEVMNSLKRDIEALAS